MLAHELRPRLFGVEFEALTLETAKTRISAAMTQKMQSLFFINAHCANVACHDSGYREALHEANLLLPDGIGVELGCRYTEQAFGDNLNGTDLFPHILQLCEMADKRVFLLGGQPGTTEQVIEWINHHYPQVNVVGHHHGHFDETHDEEVVAQINHAKTDVLFVAMGVPRQELWIHKHAYKLNTSLNIAVGGLFEFYSGNIPRAPKPIRAMRMEWVWRLCQEPKRLWRRYILGSATYLLKILNERRHMLAARKSILTRFNNAHIYYLHMRLYYLRLSIRCAQSLRNSSRRAIDIVGSGFAIAALLPFFPFIALLIKFDSPGDIFFQQWRVGKSGKHFKLIKFRSMCTDAESQLAELKNKNEKRGGVMFKMTNDPRITPFGRFLRKYSIDELPQLWNVFIGEMSLVGPRPALACEVEQYYRYQRNRIMPKPGITSQWVVEGRNNLSFAEQAELDVNYYFNGTVWSDIKILLKTIPVVLTGRGAS